MSDIADLANGLDRSKPFFPVAANYFMAMFGGIYLGLRGTQGVELQMRITDPAKLHLGRLWGNLELRCESQREYLEVGVDLVGKEIADNPDLLIGELRRSAMAGLFALAYEVTNRLGVERGKDPALEFLRHCRNAAVHNGRFHFLRDEPKHPAFWRGMIVKKELQGTPLIKEDDGTGMLSPGDPIRLLLDIEKAYPQMR